MLSQNHMLDKNTVPLKEHIPGNESNNCEDCSIQNSWNWNTATNTGHSIDDLTEKTGTHLRS